MQQTFAALYLFSFGDLHLMSSFSKKIEEWKDIVRDCAFNLFYRMLGQTHVNGWNRVIASQNGGSTSYISPLRLEVLLWSRHLFNYWKK